MSKFSLIKSDLYRYHGQGGIASMVKSFLLIEGFRYMFFFRLCNRNGGIFNFILKLIIRHYSHKYGIQIPPGTSIGKGFYIGHYGTIVINGSAIIGNNVNVSPGVIIGQISRGRLKGVPTIKDRVWIGSNAIIVGNVTIGSDSLIAPGAYINFDVPDGSLVVGNPGQVSKGKGVEDYICNVWNR